MVVKAHTAQMINVCQISSTSLTRLAETAVEQAKRSGFGKSSANSIIPSTEQIPVLLCWPNCSGGGGGTGT